MTIARIDIIQTRSYDAYVIDLEMINFDTFQVTTKNIVELVSDPPPGNGDIHYRDLDPKRTVENAIGILAELERDGWNVTAAMQPIIRYLRTLTPSSPNNNRRTTGTVCVQAHITRNTPHHSPKPSQPSETAELYALYWELP